MEVDHREGVGVLWDEIGSLQFQFLVAQGLRPDHKLLDVGCGSLRGGTHFIPYLNADNYYGIDREPILVDAGLRHEVDPSVVAEKRPTLEIMDDFDFRRLRARFDFSLAQSVFTHLPLNQITRCLIRIADALTPRGVFYATFFENDRGNTYLDPITHERGGVTSHFDEDPFHYTVENFQWVSRVAGLRVSYIGDWNHPRNQKMLRFTRRRGRLAR